MGIIMLCVYLLLLGFKPGDAFQSQLSLTNL